MAAKEFGNGSDATFIDYNNDGFLDLFVCNGAGPSSGPYLLFKNNGNLNHWLKIELTGKRATETGLAPGSLSLREKLPYIDNILGNMAWPRITSRCILDCAE